MTPAFDYERNFVGADEGEGCDYVRGSGGLEDAGLGLGGQLEMDELDRMVDVLLSLRNDHSTSRYSARIPRHLQGE